MKTEPSLFIQHCGEGWVVFTEYGGTTEKLGVRHNSIREGGFDIEYLSYVRRCETLRAKANTWENQ